MLIPSIAPPLVTSGRNRTLIAAAAVTAVTIGSKGPTWGTSVGVVLRESVVVMGFTLDSAPTGTPQES